MQKHQCMITSLIYNLRHIIFYFEHEILRELLKILKFTHFKIRKKKYFYGFKLSFKLNDQCHWSFTGALTLLLFH